MTSANAMPEFPTYSRPITFKEIARYQTRRIETSLRQDQIGPPKQWKIISHIQKSTYSDVA